MPGNWIKPDGASKYHFFPMPEPRKWWQDGPKQKAAPSPRPNSLCGKYPLPDTCATDPQADTDSDIPEPDDCLGCFQLRAEARKREQSPQRGLLDDSPDY